MRKHNIRDITMNDVIWIHRYLCHQPKFQAQSRHLLRQQIMEPSPYAEEPSPYAEQRYKDGLECARRATQLDEAGHYSAAFSLYNEAVEALNQACTIAPVFNLIQTRVVEYAERACQLSTYLESIQGKDGVYQHVLYCCLFCVPCAAPGPQATRNTMSDKSKVW